jgi:hypothetical protein
MDSVKAITFTLFPDLPFELRLKIWRLIAPGPRTVSVQYLMKYDNFNGKRISKFSGWGSPDPVPIILHICREARVEALKTYQPAFRSYFHEAKTYIDFEVDTILFGAHLDAFHPIDSFVDDGPSDYLLEVFLGGEYHGADDAEKIQRMVLDVNESLYGRRAFCWDEMRLFEGLKELTIWAWDEDETYESLMAHFRGTLRNVVEKHPEWNVPGITAIPALSGNEWGKVEVHIEQAVE